MADPRQALCFRMSADVLVATEIHVAWNVGDQGKSELVVLKVSFVACGAMRRYVLDFESHHVATAWLAVDRQIVSGATFNHQPGPDGPDMLWSQWRLGSDQLPLMPWRAGTVRKASFILSAAASAAAAKACQLSEACGHIGSPPVLGPPV